MEFMRMFQVKIQSNRQAYGGIICSDWYHDDWTLFLEY
jgi:hypothetical protein